MAELPPQPGVAELVRGFMRSHPGERTELVETGACRTDGHESSSGPMLPSVQLVNKGLKVSQHTPESWQRECAYHLHQREFGYGSQHDVSTCGGNCPPANDRDMLTVQLVKWPRVREILQHEDAGQLVDCGTADLDAIERAETDRIARECRQLVARVTRLMRTDATAAELEGARVELLSKRQHAPSDALRALMTRTAYAAGHSLDMGASAYVAASEPSPLLQLAELADTRHTVCACGQTFIPYEDATRCTSCRDGIADQGSQLGFFELAPSAPARTNKAPSAPQPEGLF